MQRKTAILEVLFRKAEIKYRATIVHVYELCILNQELITIEVGQKYIDEEFWWCRKL